MSRELIRIMKFFDKAHQHRIFSEIFITNKYGTNIAQTGKTSDYYQSDERWWQEAKKDGLYVEDIEYDESSEVYAINLCVRIDDQNGNFAGVCKASLSIDEITGLLRSKEEGHHVEYKLLTKDKRLIYQTEDFEFLDKPSQGILDALPKEEVHEIHYFITEGDQAGEESKLYGCGHAEGYGEYKCLGWILLAEHDTEEILASSARLKKSLLLTLFIFSVFAALTGLFISHSIQAPLKKLKNVMTEVGKGKLDTRVEIKSKDEIGFFADSFNKMVKDLKHTTTSIVELNKEILDRKKAEMVKEKLLYDLGNRIKEIRCLYGLSELVDKSGLSLKKAFQEAVNLIPQGWQYPEITCAKIVFKDSEYKTDNYETSRWKQSVDIRVHEKKIGSLEVYYLQEKHPADEGPFLKEERDLINALAERLGKTAEHKVIEDHLDQHRHNLETLVDERTSELKETQSQLIQNEKLASIGQLAAGVAHEMNTPVGFVASNFQTLDNYVKKIRDLVTMYDELIAQIETSEKSELLNKAKDIGQSRDDMKIDFILEDINVLFDDSREGLDRVTEIIQNLRDFSRIDQPGSCDKYNINKGIEATLIVAKNEIKYDADVKTDFSEVPPIFCHSGQINQVFLNLLVNAAQAIKGQERDGNGAITIKTYTSDDNEAVCEISDDGPGIAPETLSKIFDPFFTTKPPGKGTGLGLSVSHDIIVNKHKGKLFVDSTVGEGTKFTIKLPIGTKANNEKEIISNG